ncbi:GTPase-activating protein gyp3 [Apiospora kogelbergensis]|uniref:GTPase-activating protein gyp3 n=1 Tax=Apiospora kogelbergensis TaxID=1337665 RepID=A0AAW0Q967_9PEZI
MAMPGDIGRGPGLPTSPVEGNPGHLNDATATSVRGPSNVKRERSDKFRPYGLYASKASSSRPASPIPTSLPSPASFSHGPARHLVADHEHDNVVERFATARPATSASYNHPTRPYHREIPDDNSSSVDFGPQVPPAPLTPLSPRWDSLGQSHTVLHNQSQPLPPSKTTVLTYPTSHSAFNSPGHSTFNSPGLLTPHEYEDEDEISLSSEFRDEFPPPSPSQFPKMNSIESRHVGGDPMIGNFSRPRRPSVKQPYPEHIQSRLHHTMSSATDPTPTESPTTHQGNLLWPRERGHSISSNKSTATFASLPMRPSPDTQLRETARSRSRQANPLARPPMAYSRTESSGPRSLSRDPIPRMASMPSGEMRSSYRSHTSASTQQGTSQTERSSVATKNSSITSINGFSEPLDEYMDDGEGEGDDEEFSVDDVMGMYEKGFRDSLAPAEYFAQQQRQQDEMSRPPTGASEKSRRKSAMLQATMLEAMSDSLPIPGQPHWLFLTKVWAERSAESEKHDSGKLVDLPPPTTEEDDDEEDDFPTRNPGKTANMTLPEDADDSERDRYGFRKHNQYVSQEQYDQWNGGYTEYIERRRRKWTAFLKESGLMTDNPNRFPQRSTKTKRFVRKGIPPEWRGAAWFYYAGGPAIVAKHAGVYDGLLKQKAKDVDNEAIERDLHRTFPDNIKFRSPHNSSTPNTEAGAARNRNSQATLTAPSGNAARADETAMISSLRRVLHAFSIYNPRIGYCQSLNFLAGLLLLFVESEEQAFWLLNIITRVYLPGTHEMSLEGANVDLAVLMSSLRDSMPAVWTKIGGELDGTDAVKPKSRRHRKGPEPTRLPPITLCMTAWFMSCFIGTLPIETTLRVWDVFFYEGSKTLFRIALAIFKIGESEIKSVSDPMEIFQVVQTIPRRLIDANGLMESCFKRRNGFGHLSQDTIEQRRQERRDNVKIENARLAAGMTTEDPGELKKKGTFLGKKTR